MRRLFIAIILALTITAAAATVAGVEYGYTSTIIKPHLPGKVTLVNSSLKLQDVHIDFTANTVTAQVYNNGTAAESSRAYIGVNDITSAIYSSPGQDYTVQANSTASVVFQIPSGVLARAYNIIVTW